MGYYVRYTIKVPTESIDEVVLTLNTLSDYEFQKDGNTITNEEPYSGFDPYTVFPKLSSNFPDIAIKVLFDGESSDDLTVHVYKNGEHVKEVDLISDIYKKWESYL